MEDIQDKRPRGKGSKGPYRKTEPDAPIPEVIKLPDGRLFLVADLVGKRTGSKNYNLLDHKIKIVKSAVPKTPGRKLKYTMEDRKWQAVAPANAIAEKYGMTLRVARSVKTYARQIINMEQSEDSYIIDYTKKG